MAFERRVPRVNWRGSLTTDEATEVAEIERRVAEMRAECADLTRRLDRIRDRATKRATFVPAALRRRPQGRAA